LLDGALSLIAQLLWGQFLGGFTYLLLFEAALLFLASGSMDLTSSRFVYNVRQYLMHSKEGWSEEQHHRAQRQGLTYAGAGALALIESILLSMI
jgi:hypothetical protein